MDQSTDNFAVEKTRDTKIVTIGARNFQVPAYTRLDDRGCADSRLVTYKSGDELAEHVEITGSASASMALGFGPSLSASLHNTLRRYVKSDRQYALYEHQSILYRVALPTIGIEQTMHTAYSRATRLLPEWDSTNQGVVNAYADYFRVYGTHVITSVNYGWRYQLKVDCINESIESQKNFKSNVMVQFNGIVAKAKVNAEYKQSEQYRRYLAASNTTCHVLGGAVQLTSEASRIPDSTDAYGRWLSGISSGRDEALIGFKTIQLGLLYRSSDETALVRAGESIDRAFNYMASFGPKENLGRIAFRLSKDSDWAALDILSNNCHIDVPSPWPSAVCEMTEKRVNFGTIRHFEVSHIEFEVVHSGGLIDIRLTRGDAGTGGVRRGWAALRLGSADVAVNARNVTGDGLNEMTFCGLSAQ